jgi:hypothetical protein
VAALRVADAYWREGDRVPGMRAVDRAWTAYRCARDEGASEAELAPLAHAFAVAVLAAGDG